ncbi:MAG TPA: hypothetical protein VGE16_14540 [Albitalea sp.]
MGLWKGIAMKSISLLVAAAFALSGAAMAQTQSLPDTPTQLQTPMTPAAPAPATPAPVATAAETPAPIVVETNVDLTSEPGPPADPQAAREEAVNALHWAKTEGCRNDAAPRECIRRAQDEYRDAMARLGRTGVSRN